MAIRVDDVAEDPLRIVHGDCVAEMATMPEASIDAIVTDPPYDLTGTARPSSTEVMRGVGRGFMGKAWDGTGVAFEPQTWARAMRVLRPGGYLLAFGGTRTFHRMTCAIEDAGFTVRDCLMWLYGQGFPKSNDVSWQIDKSAGVTRDDRRTTEYGDNAVLSPTRSPIAKGEPVTDLAKRWSGWGTSLKPAWEPIVLAQKPLDGTYARNLARHGVGAINVEASRIGTDDTRAPTYRMTSKGHIGGAFGAKDVDHARDGIAGSASGRWPANVLLDDVAATMLDSQSDGASRFFYVAKASKSDRGTNNAHPTVKPVELMRYLVRLVTPPRGIVLDPFAGSGTTGQAALAEGMRCVLIEREAEYVEGIKKWRGAMQIGLGLAVGE